MSYHPRLIHRAANSQVNAVTSHSVVTLTVEAPVLLKRGYGYYFYLVPIRGLGSYFHDHSHQWELKGENEELKKKLADKVVDKINANALKSAESALAYKEKVIAEKDEVIADLGNELEATKKELEAFKESYKRRIKEDSEHFEHIQKICNAGLQKWLIESEYLEKDKPFRFPQQPELSEEELMKLQEKACVDMAEEGKDHSGVIVLCGKDLIDALKKVKDVWQE